MQNLFFNLISIRQNVMCEADWENTSDAEMIKYKSTIYSEGL